MVADVLTQPRTESLPETWSLWRYRHVAGLLRRGGRPSDSLIDLGCGAGNVTRFLADELGISRVVGVEEDPVQIREARRLGLEVRAASLLDESLPERIAERFPERFQVALLGDVLHHLTGRTIEDSFRRVRRVLAAAAALLEKGGTLIVAEPVYRCRWLRDGTYHLKRTVSRWRRGRLELGPRWLNVGPPVVRFFDRRELLALIEGSGLRVEAVVESDHQRLAGVFARGRITLLAQPARSTSSESGRSTATATRSPERR
ncbi:MAG: class I SAM-dependent methyltransferase [Acidobacteriota bacterium]